MIGDERVDRSYMSRRYPETYFKISLINMIEVVVVVLVVTGNSSSLASLFINFNKRSMESFGYK